MHKPLTKNCLTKEAVEEAAKKIREGELVRYDDNFAYRQVLASITNGGYNG